MTKVLLQDNNILYTSFKTSQASCEQSHEKIGLFAYAKTRGADQRLCFCYTDSTILLLISSFKSSSVGVQAGLCQTWLETSQDQYSHVMAIATYSLL